MEWGGQKGWRGCPDVPCASPAVRPKPVRCGHEQPAAAVRAPPPASAPLLASTCAFHLPFGSSGERTVGSAPLICCGFTAEVPWIRVE